MKRYFNLSKFFQRPDRINTKDKQQQKYRKEFLELNRLLSIFIILT